MDGMTWSHAINNMKSIENYPNLLTLKTFSSQF